MNGNKAQVPVNCRGSRLRVKELSDTRIKSDAWKTQEIEKSGVQSRDLREFMNICCISSKIRINNLLIRNVRIKDLLLLAYYFEMNVN